MKRDLDALMTSRNLDAILVSGKVLGNPPLIYLLNGAHLTRGILIKKRGETPSLIVGPMDRASAAVAGYPVLLTTRYGYSELVQQHHGDELAASVAYYQRIFEDLGISGRLGCYGFLDQGYAYTLLTALNAALPSVEIVGEMDPDLIRVARATKDADEVRAIREVGVRTIAVVRQTLAFLQSYAVGDDETLRTQDGAVLTVGRVHEHIARLVAAEGLEDPEGFIFSTGSDAGIPHSRGTVGAPMRLGEPIVFDIFPRQMGGGYFFDLTRTFCLGYAPEPVARLHRDVVDCLTTVKASLRVGQEVRRYQQMTCAFFSARGHPTIADDPAIQRGYVHSVGHGVGLDIHEVPSFTDSPGNTMVLEPGHVFAFEPGLYYPEQGMGCRVEDVVWVEGDGEIRTLTEMPYDLVVPMPGWSHERRPDL
ncbi:MAG: M24 family metallopeptidase [Anaerolineae bacterium]|jgi:Xaa-Pro aminopeptidase|nr:M24 family metallopeptidase [Anaerolineae bacterium]